MSYVVLDPRGRVIPPSTMSLAALPARLAGLTIGLLDNEKEQADVILARVAGFLERRGATSLGAAKWSQSVVATPEVLDRFDGCDLVITALGG